MFRWMHWRTGALEALVPCPHVPCWSTVNGQRGRFPHHVPRLGSGHCAHKTADLGSFANGAHNVPQTYRK
eukprot:2006064-Pyramimonas_sp.AAC.1